jgi:peptidoglycan/xylan/chitin deacetylase (PgdA/CDA1 family)
MLFAQSALSQRGVGVGARMNELPYKAVLSAIGAAARIAKRLSPTIFCFHSVRDARSGDFESGLSVTTSFIEGLIDVLGELSIPILSLEQAFRRVGAGDVRPFVVLTFDDGYLDNYTTLYPLMLRRHTPFTIFVTTGLIDGTLPMWWDVIERLRHGGGDLRVDGNSGLDQRPEHGGDGAAALTAYFRGSAPAVQTALVAELLERNCASSHQGGATLSWANLAEMQGSGLLTVGAHTVNHPLLSTLSATEVRDEIFGARERIAEMLGSPPAFLAYPFGQPSEVGPWAADAARDAGYSAAFTTEAVPLRLDDARRPFAIPRVLLSRKADHPNIALAYMSGLPSRLNQLGGRR